MYSLPNPSESERPFSPLEEPVLLALGRRGGRARNGTDSYALRQGRHAIGRGGYRIQRPHIIGSGQLVLGWRVRWGEGWGLGVKERGWRIFYRRPVLTSITLVFFKSMCSAHSPCGIKRPTISKF
jgi:hypothetical protein